MSRQVIDRKPFFLIEIKTKLEYILVDEFDNLCAPVMRRQDNRGRYTQL